MKKIAITLSALLAAASAFAQGTVTFTTIVPGSIDARVVLEGTGEPVGSTHWGQLLAGPVGGDLVPVGQPVEFRDTPEAARGYITSGAVTIPGVAGGSPAEIRLVAWHKDLGDSWEEAFAAGQAGLGGYGMSDIITVETGGAGTPPSLPTNLVGLEGFEVLALVPEPTIAALGLLGAGLLLFRRKK